jgi:hypothetical protein
MSPEIARKTRWYGGRPPTHLFLFGEQGLGDVIQFVRFVTPPPSPDTATTVIAQPQLLPLLSTMPQAPHLQSKDQSIKLTPGARWAHLISLPFLTNWSPGRPCAVPPYLFAERARVARWRSVLGDHGFKIGLCWRGASARPPHHFLALSQLAPLAQLDNVRLISLQKGDGEQQARSVPFSVETLDGLDEDGAFLDTAAVMENLDLVVTVDTSIAHLAGAMARPVYIMLHGAWPDWRWLNSESDETIWYPTARLFRQKKIGDWTGVVSEIIEAIHAAR